MKPEISYGGYFSERGWRVRGNNLKAFTLLEPDDMRLRKERVIVASGGVDDLFSAITTRFEEKWQEQWIEEDKELVIQERAALEKMLKLHNDYSAGLHELEPIEPLWIPWYLIVVEEENEG